MSVKQQVRKNKDVEALVGMIVESADGGRVLLGVRYHSVKYGWQEVLNAYRILSRVFLSYSTVMYCGFSSQGG